MYSRVDHPRLYGTESEIYYYEVGPAIKPFKFCAVIFAQGLLRGLPQLVRSNQEIRLTAQKYLRTLRTHPETETGGSGAIWQPGPAWEKK